MVSGYFSNRQPVRSGVPHGLILGPMLFNTFRSDLHHGIKCTLKMFVNDQVGNKLQRVTTSCCGKGSQEAAGCYNEGSTSRDQEVMTPLCSALVRALLEHRAQCWSLL